MTDRNLIRLLAAVLATAAFMSSIAQFFNSEYSMWEAIFTGSVFVLIFSFTGKHSAPHEKKENNGLKLSR